MRQRVIQEAIKDKIIQATKEDARNCGSVCLNYVLMKNVFEPDRWFVRYEKAWTDRRNIYRWICFNKDGEVTECDPEFANPSTSNKFYKAMTEVMKLGNVFDDKSNK